jgi:tetratricopeptide (TPR) repeat protein
MNKFAVIAVLLVAAAGSARAEIAMTAEERALLARVDAEEFIKARADAEKILAANPDSFVANWAMARVHHDEEGNHARALYFVHKAEKLLADKNGNDPDWDRKCMLEEVYILQEMDRNTEVLAVMDRYEGKYGGGHEELRIWPLFKLGRSDEARKVAIKLTTSEDWLERAHGYNGMLSIEYEAHDRDATYRWAVEAVRGTQERSCTVLHNAAGSSYTRFHLREAEDYATRAHSADVHDCSSSGFDALAGLYLIEGEFQKCLAALDSLRKEPIPKRYRPHFALERRAILSDLLLALGKVEEAYTMAADLYAMPPRVGMVSSSVDVERFGRTFRYWAALDAKLILMKEKRSYRPIWAWFSFDTVPLQTARWEARRNLIQLSAEDDLLVNVVRPNLGDINDVTPWRTPALADVLGSGVIRLASEEARRRDAKYPEASAYLDALDGELQFQKGNLEEADRLASSALKGLPKEEALLRWRTMAWQADALRRLGKMDAAKPLYQTVMRNFPSIFRLMDLPVPVRMAGKGEVSDKIAKSSRFVVTDGAPFHVDVNRRGEYYQICLADDSGSQVACGGNEPPRGDNKDPTRVNQDIDPDPVLAAIDGFHAEVFSPKVSLTQADLNSLDGSTVRVGADEALKGVLNP